MSSESSHSVTHAAEYLAPGEPRMIGLRIRRDIRDLDVDQLRRLRFAFARLQADQGRNGYQALAGHHGVPDWYCLHGTALLLPWHREYLLRMEAALRAIDDTIHLPFFDWADDRAARVGLPAAYTDASYALADGTLLPNPLASAAVAPLGRRSRRASSWNPTSLRSFAQSVDLAQLKKSFREFSQGLEGPNGSFHVWVGGDMGSSEYSAYDPVFWAHHATVDRQWAMWQQSARSASPSPVLLNQELPGFAGRRVLDVMDHAALGYDYAGLDGIRPDPVGEATRRSTRPGGDDQQAGTSNVRGSSVRTGRVVLSVDGVRRNAGSFSADVFIDLPAASPDTPILGNPHFAGAFGIMGMAHGQGAPVHRHTVVGLAPDELDFECLALEVDITEAVRRLGVLPEGAEVTLVPRTSSGVPIDVHDLPIGEMRIDEIVSP